MTNLEKSLRHLEKLHTLRLPRHTSLTTTTTVRWPSTLHRVQVSGTFSTSAISSFSWPPHLNSRTLENCNDLSVNSLGSLISSPQLDSRLRRLTISHLNRNLQPESICAIPAFLPRLAFLSVPGDLVDDAFFDLLRPFPLSAPLSLQVLELGYPYLDPEVGFQTTSLLDTLDAGLSQLRSVGFAEVFVTERRIVEDEEIDLALQKRADEHARRLGADAHNYTDVGVYYL